MTFASRQDMPVNYVWTRMKKNAKPLILTIGLIVSLLAGSIFADEIPDERIQKHSDRIVAPYSTESPSFQSQVISWRTSGFTDLQVSASVAPATFSQRFSSLARLADGRIVACWQDNRNGNMMIFTQIFDADGNRSGSNMLVLGRDDENNIIEPKVVSDGLGGFFLAWRDEATGWLFAARYDHTMNRQNLFVVNDVSGGGFAGPYDIASYPGGRLAVVWENYQAGNTIALRIFSNAGAPLTDVIMINGDGGGSAHWVPAVAVEHPSGNMAITWEDYRNGNADIYMQFVNADGSLYGTNRRVIDFEYTGYAQYAPDIAFSAVDGYAIGWLDKRSGTQRVYLQRITRSGGLIGSNVNISDNAAGTQDWDISMAVNSTGNLAVAWASVDTNDRILLQKFSAGLVKNGSPIRVNNLLPGARWQTSLVCDASDRFYCSWSDYRRGNWDIYLQRLNIDGSSLLAEDMLLNDDALGAHSTEPAICYFDNFSGYVITFADSRSDNGDIFYQFVNANGTLNQENFQANKDIQPALQREPDLATLQDVGLLVWNDNRAINGMIGQRIFARLFNRFLTMNPPMDYNEVIISDSSSTSPKSDPSVAINADAFQLISWIDYASGNGQLFARFIIPANPYELGTILEVSNPDAEFDNTDVNVMSDGNDIFTIAWMSLGTEGGPSAIFARYDANAEFINRFSFKSDLTGIAITEIASAVYLDGDIYLLWRGENETGHLYLTALDNTGTVVNPTFEITNHPDADPEAIDIAVDDNGVVVAVWIDSRNGRKEAFYQILDNEFNPIGVNTPVSPTEQRYMMSPRVAVDGQSAAIVWVDPRKDGNNVYMSQIDYAATDIGDDATEILPVSYSLEQNFPNPFNPFTAIQFSLPARSPVNISIYDILGRKINLLTDDLFEAGTHSVEWDGTNSSGQPVASGIYFYRMEAGTFTQTRKMILLK